MGDVALCSPNMFDSFPYRGPKAPAASMYALQRSRVERIPAHDASITQRTYPPNYSCFHLRGRPRLSGVQSQRSSIMTTIQNPPKSDMTTPGLTWSRAAKNAVHIRPKNTILNRFLGKTCSSLSFHDAPGRRSFCVVVAIYAQLRVEAGSLGGTE